MSKLPRVKLHPASIKHIRKGHPWIIADSYTAKFPKHSFLVGTDNQGKEIALLINDPKHPRIKARCWSLRPNPAQERDQFRFEMTRRLERALRKRDPIIDSGERENFYLVFGEGDFLPGLFIQKLGVQILVQMYSNNWELYEVPVKKFLHDHFPNSPVWFQQRGKNGRIERMKGKGEPFFENCEFGIKYKLDFSQGQDMGLYTDMSAVRKRLSSHFAEAKSVLNLFSYTGAFALYALSKGADRVCSVDLSSRYLDWLDENLLINEKLDPQKHERREGAAVECCQDLINEGRHFDLIICDPPSSSSDGKKQSSALKSYELLLPLFLKLLNNGGHVVCFLNNHSVNRRQFEQHIRTLMGKEFEIKEKLSMSEDCPVVSGFPEGDYLKGLVLRKTSP